MNKHQLLKARLYFTAFVAVAAWMILAWNHFHGGVASHHFLANKDLPAISNWWGGVLLPLLTWYLLARVQKNVLGKSNAFSAAPQPLLSVCYGLAGALLFGAIISVLFALGENDLAGNTFLALFALALFVPIYRPESYLGFVLSMCFTFGTVLPMIIGFIIGLIGFVLYAYIRTILLFVLAKIAPTLSFSKQKLD